MSPKGRRIEVRGGVRAPSARAAVAAVEAGSGRLCRFLSTNLFALFSFSRQYQTYT
jgi:hypothetical protein